MDTNEYSLGDQVRAIQDCYANIPNIVKGDVYWVTQRKNGMIWLNGNNNTDQGHPQGEFEYVNVFENVRPGTPTHHEMPRVDVERINKILQESRGWRDIDGVAYVALTGAEDPTRLNQPWNYTPEFFSRAGLEIRVQVREIKTEKEND